MILIRVKPTEEGLALSKLFLYNCGKNDNHILRCILMDFTILHSRQLTLSLVPKAASAWDGGIKGCNMG